jgi:hypothetical protein
MKSVPLPIALPEVDGANAFHLWRMFCNPMVFDFTRYSAGHSESPCLRLLAGASGRHNCEGDLTLDKS